MKLFKFVPIALLTTIAGFSFLMPSVAMVLAGSANVAPNALPNPLTTSTVQGVLYLIADIATYIGVIVAVIAIIFAGFKFVAARGNPEKIVEARRFLFYVIIGVAILIGAAAIVDIVKNTLTSAGVVQSGVFNGTH